MGISFKEFGRTPDGTVIHQITMENRNGIQVEVLNLGGVIRSLRVPDSNGEKRDIVLGFDRLEDYRINSPNFGAVIGRLVGPVPDCRLEYDGKTVLLPPSKEGGKHVHGGKKGFARSIWEFQTKEAEGVTRLELRYESPDGDDGYPGTIRAAVIYELTDEDNLEIMYEGESDQEVPFNPTNHSYFNLNGHQSGNVYGQKLQIFHEKVVIDGIPTPAESTAADLNVPEKIGDLMCDLNHFHFLKGEGMRTVMNMWDEEGKRALSIDTDCSGAVVYAGGNLDHVNGKEGAVYGRGSGLAFEPCFVRDEVPFNPSHCKLVGPSHPFSSRIRYRFIRA